MYLFFLRWDLDLHLTIVPSVIHDTKAVHESDPNLYLRLFSESFQNLAKGVEMYCAALNQTVKVFAYVYAVYGDLPGRCAIGGLKCGTMASRLVQKSTL
jgi:hypothetical protein